MAKINAMTRIQIRRQAAALMIILAALLATFGFILFVLGPLSWWLATDAVRNLRGKEQADAFNTVRQTVMLAFGGAVALVGAAFTIRSYVLARRGQITDRFSKATTQLASSLLEERLGGLYALEHIMAESSPDHATVLEVLSAFVRVHAPMANAGGDDRKPVVPWERPDPPERPAWGTKPPVDLQAVMTVLARRPVRAEPYRPHLSGVSLPGLSIREHEFSRAPRLTRMFFTGADLRAADFRGADLSGSILNYADLRWVWFGDATLVDSKFSFADLRGATLARANIDRAYLRGANLEDVHDLTASQLATALIDENTILPASLRNDPWVIARLAACDAWRMSNSGLSVPPPTAIPALSD